MHIRNYSQRQNSFDVQWVFSSGNYTRRRISDIIPSLTVFLREEPRKSLNKRSARLLYVLRLHVTSLYFLVFEQIFLIFAIGTICFDVQKPTLVKNAVPLHYKKQCDIICKNSEME